MGIIRRLLIMLMLTIIFVALPLINAFSQVPTDNLIAYYPFNANTNDESGNGHSAINYGATLTADRFNNTDKAYSFDGISNKILVTNFHPTINNFSVSIWLNTPTVSIGNSTRWLIGDGAHYNGYIIMQQQDSLRFQVFGGVGVTQGDYGVALTSADQGNWIHVVMTNQNGTMKIYKNGLFVKTGASPSVATTSTYSLGIGHDELQWFNSYWNGRIDDIRIYDYAISDDEINALYHEGGWNGNPNPPAITSYTPTRNSLNIAKNTNITISFDADIDQSTLNSSTIKINGSQSGLYNFTSNYSSSNKTITITPSSQFRVGELITVTATRGIKSTIGDPLVKALNWSFTIQTTMANNSFSQNSISGAGNSPAWMTTADFDKNGALDLAITNYSPNNSVTILKNNGNGNFTASQTIGVGTFPDCVTAGDIDGNGYPDLLVGNNTGRSVSVLINDGTGNFNVSSTLSINGRPYSITVGDWNSDGSLDIAVSNSDYSNTVDIFTNDGTGIFTKMSSMNVAGDAHGITTGDFNNDGYLDLAFTRWRSPAAIYLNNGDCNFTLSQYITTGTDAVCIAAGDIDGDEDIDLIITNHNSSNISIIKNNGNGFFASSIDMTVSGHPIGITLTDFNGNGILDLAITSDSLYIFKNNGSGVFSIDKILPLTDASGFATGDFNGDGTIDVAATKTANSNTVTIFLNTWIPPSLIAHYSFNNNAIDSSSYKNDGIVNGGMSWVDDRFGNLNSAAGFDGVDDYVLVPNSISLQSPRTAISITSWIYIDSYPSGHTAVAGIVNKTNTPDYGQYGLSVHAWGTPGVLTVIGTGGAGFPMMIDLKQWHFIAFTWDGAAITLYVDGFNMGSQPFSGPINADNYPLTLGMESPGLTEFLRGSLDDIRIYNYALTISKIDSLYHEGGWPNHSPIANSGPDQIVECTSPAGAQVILDGRGSSDPDNDPLTFTWQEGANTIAGPTTDSTATAVLPFGTHTILLTIIDGKGGTSGDTVLINVQDTTPPVIAEIIAPINPIKIDTQITVSAAFTDQWGTHTAIWQWGDGSTSEGVVNETNGCGSVTGSHIYDTTGVYTIKLILTDQSQNSAEAIYQYIVIFNPDAGFVTGGGWIISPKGSYAPDTSLTGKANFGFISKYKKGASVPTGETEFQFKVANLKFKSTSYEWLVIAGKKAKYKGLGSINNNGNYGFMLTAIDGQWNNGNDPDKFRIKIWDKNSSDVIVYDNQMGSSDDADAVLAIDGGSIVIHSNGLFKIGAEEYISSIPDKFSLDQNYPNPFNPSTTIKYGLPERSQVRLIVYDILGQVVANLVNSEQQPGIQLVEWNANVASGLYFYRIEATSIDNPDNRFVETKKMLLVK